MADFVVNSDRSLQEVLGTLRELYAQNRYVKVKATVGKHRSLDQNAIFHAWTQQLALELKEDDALGWKSYCKLHHGIPILRAEDEDFRAMYDAALKPLSYEQKLDIMIYMPVSSLMTKPQLSKFLEAIQADFQKRGVFLEFPDD